MYSIESLVLNTVSWKTYRKSNEGCGIRITSLNYDKFVTLQYLINAQYGISEQDKKE